MSPDILGDLWSFAHANTGRRGLVRGHGKVDIWDSGLLLYVRASFFCQVGSLMYKGFVTFTTTGYGDYSPKTAAGRSVFVFWALLGLATMTILVSGALSLFRGNSSRLVITRA